MTFWRDEDINCLIDIVQNAPYVWDVSSPEYKKKQKKHSFWAGAADKVNRACNPEAKFTRDDCFKKWVNLRTYFNAENNKIMKSKKSGAPADSVGITGKVWKYLTKMKFLRGNMLPKVNTFNQIDISMLDGNTNSSIECGAVLDKEDEEESNSPKAVYLGTATPLVQRNIKKKKTSDDQEVVERANNLTTAITQQMKAEVKHPSAFGIYVNQCLDKLDADLNLEAREEINIILYRYETQQLERN